jgi:hypothetical protein
MSSRVRSDGRGTLLEEAVLSLGAPFLKAASWAAGSAMRSWKAYMGLRGVERENRRFREEIRDLLRPPARAARQSDPLERTRGRLLEDREITGRKREESCWLRIQPVEGLGLDLGDGRLDEYLREPRKTGNRLSGWKFANPYLLPRRKRDRLVQGEPGGPITEILADGGIRFTAPIASLYGSGPERELWPLALLEYPVSIVRLARAVYQDIKRPRDPRILADMALYGVGGWSLRPSSPVAAGYRLEGPRNLDDAEDFVSEEPLAFDWEEVVGEPDRCGFRLVRRVYEAFGFGEESIPREFDRKSGRLVLRE